MVTAPMLGLAFWRNAAGAAALVPVLLTRERATPNGLLKLIIELLPLTRDDMPRRAAGTR